MELTAYVSHKTRQYWLAQGQRYPWSGNTRCTQQRGQFTLCFRNMYNVKNLICRSSVQWWYQEFTNNPTNHLTRINVHLWGFVFADPVLWRQAVQMPVLSRWPGESHTQERRCHAGVSSYYFHFWHFTFYNAWSSFQIECSVCGLRQPVQQKCDGCGTVFGKYFCFECKLYDDEDKKQFHCFGCGICRVRFI